MDIPPPVRNGWTLPNGHLNPTLISIYIQPANVRRQLTKGLFIVCARPMSCYVLNHVTVWEAKSVKTPTKLKLTMLVTKTMSARTRMKSEQSKMSSVCVQFQIFQIFIISHYLQTYFTITHYLQKIH